ncbi:MAG: hypothetical protein KDC92_04055 [Bacteroidetes bacterium]|nr:hypothetical protein [Bacteroidota bacterium]
MVAILAVGNEIYKATIYRQDLDVFNPTLDNFFVNEPGADVLYFGESSNFHLEKPGAKKVRISDYIDSLLPSLQVNPVDNAGLEASNYLHILKNLPNLTSVKAIIVTMNLRSFGYTWILDDNYNFRSRSNEFAKKRPPLLNRLLVSLKAYDHYTHKELSKATGEHKTSDPINWPFKLSYNTLKQWNDDCSQRNWEGFDSYTAKEARNLASHYIKNFGFAINAETNERIKDFDEIVAFAKERNLKVIFHLLAENMQQAEELLGEEMIWCLNHNAELLVNRYHNGNDVWVTNNLNLLADSAFVDRHFPIEHYNNAGKKACAIQVVKWVEEALLKF